MRGEGNHKIPGSFAPENMEKTGAERVKYSLACQHEDAISIKFVSYAQKCPTVLCTFAVALRKESVDRNTIGPLIFSVQAVALRKESVDRNSSGAKAAQTEWSSLSARRAWIEILPSMHYSSRTVPSLSARRAWIEIFRLMLSVRLLMWSLSARRAWIEILLLAVGVNLGALSLSARRAWIEIFQLLFVTAGFARRSPQGERG